MNVVFVGGGHITRALLGGLAAAGRTDGVIVVERNADKRRRLAADFNIRAEADFPADAPPMCVIAVRPPQVRAVCEQLAGCRTLFVSLAAGLQCETLAAWLGGGRVVRAMPNTPAQVGAGMTFCNAGAESGGDDKQLAEALFSAVGKVAWLADERLLDAAAAVSGGGPAYVYYFVEAMRAAAVKMNLPEEAALAAVLQTFRGAIAVLEKGEHTPGELCDAVAVKGGTTERALAVFESHQLREVIAKALHAAAARAGEIGGGSPPAADSPPDNS